MQEKTGGLYETDFDDSLYVIGDGEEPEVAENPEEKEKTYVKAITEEAEEFLTDSHEIAMLDSSEEKNVEYLSENAENDFVLGEDYEADAPEETEAAQEESSAEKEASVDSDEESQLIIDGENNQEKPKKKRKSVIITLGMVAGVVVLAAAAFFTCSYYWIKGDLVMPKFIADTGLYQGDGFKFFDSVSINGVKVGGLTLAEAKQKVMEYAKKNPQDCNIYLQCGEQEISFGKDDVEYTLVSDDALYEAKNDCLKVMLGKSEKKKKDYKVSYTFSDECFENIYEKAKAVIFKEPESASFTMQGNEFVYKDEVAGYELDKDALISEIKEKLAAGELNLSISVKTLPIEPTVKRSDIEGNIVLLGEYSTTSTNNANGNFNMKKAMDMCSGSIIEAGDTWSFNAHTGDSTKGANGWKAAAAYQNGYVVDAMGGGICQASTTIYNAALYANLTVAERYNHTWASNYAKPGLDATINYPSADLKLKNDTGYPVYISCSMTGKVLNCKIYGHKAESYDEIRVSTSTTEHVEGSHYRVAAKRTLYKNGAVVKSESLPSSKYSLKPKETQAQAEARRAAEAQQAESSSSEAAQSSESPSSAPAEQPSPPPPSPPADNTPQDTETQVTP